MAAIRPIEPAQVDEVAVRGQYIGGFISGRQVKGYRQEKGVAPDSRTETYAALKLHVDNWRWAGVPFFLRTSKRLPKRASEIVISFRRTPHMIFRRSPTGVQPNLLIVRIQPDEGIALTITGKTPGPDLKLATMTMDFRYDEVFGGHHPEAYERLLLDAIHGDATLYARGDWVEQSWKILTPILDAWAADGEPAPYEAGAWGPPEADAFIARDAARWHVP
jgi:glucose-6-phosphate 1-dehydrogenase